MSFILNRLQEESTWCALTFALSAFNVLELTQPQSAAVAALGLAFAGAPDGTIKRLFITKKL